MNDIFVIKKNGALEPFSNEKIIKAVNKAQARVDVELTKTEQDFICSYVVKKIEDNCPEIEGQIRMGVYELHPIVEEALEQVNKKVAKSYKEYRDYKKQNNEMLETILSENETLETEGNRDNANADSRLITTKRFLEGCALSKASYQRFYLSPKEVQANNDGYIYIHDLALRKYTFNCCVANFQNILTGGFTMGSIHYVEPKTLPAFFNVSGDITLSASSQQYGGFSIPEFDTLSAKYAKLSFDKYFEEEKTNTEKRLARRGLSLTEEDIEDCRQTALDKVRADYRQGFQGLECMLNSCANAKGDYSFVSLSFGLGEGIFEQMATEEILKVRMEGQGPKGHKKPVLFPKLIFLYDEKKHAEGCPLHHLFLMTRDCSCVCMYPDYFNVRQVEEETARNYEKYGKAVTPMGCRSAVSPFYESGNYTQVDENDIPVTQGRFNIGVVSLNLPMILAKARKNKKDFYQVLDYYLDIIRGIHKKTRAQLSKLKASSNPLMFMEGGLWHGNLQANDTIEPIMKAATASFGITALNELQRLYNGKSLIEDNQFALEVSQYIFNKLKEFKAEDGIAYSIYGTPAESLSGKQVLQFRNKFGIIEGVSDRDYFSNSFHCHVSENITPIEKQKYEEQFWPYFSGGRIQYNRISRPDINKNAVLTCINEAMKRKFYYGVNFPASYCEKCGKSFTEPVNYCPHCGAPEKFITTYDRVCGYLGQTRVAGDTRLNKAKLCEIKDRKSM